MAREQSNNQSNKEEMLRKKAKKIREHIIGKTAKVDQLTLALVKTYSDNIHESNSHGITNYSFTRESKNAFKTGIIEESLLNLYGRVLGMNGESYTGAMEGLNDAMKDHLVEGAFGKTPSELEALANQATPETLTEIAKSIMDKEVTRKLEKELLGINLRDIHTVEAMRSLTGIDTYDTGALMKAYQQMVQKELI